MKRIGPTGVLQVFEREHGQLKVEFSSSGDEGGQHARVRPMMNLANARDAVVVEPEESCYAESKLDVNHAAGSHVVKA